MLHVSFLKGVAGFLGIFNKFVRMVPEVWTSLIAGRKTDNQEKVASLAKVKMLGKSLLLFSELCSSLPLIEEADP